MGLHAEHSVQLTEQFQKQSSVLIFVEDGPMPGTTIHHVVPGAWKFDAQRPSHSETIAQTNEKTKI